jgi:hypothetical protein
MKNLPCAGLVVLVLLFSHPVLFSQGTESYRATSFIRVTQSAVCQNDAYAVLTLSPPAQALTGSLVFFKLSIRAPEGSQIAWVQPYTSREEERWDIAANIILKTIVNSTIEEIPGVSTITNMVDAIEKMSAYFERHKRDNVSEISFTVHSPQNISAFSLSYLLHLSFLGARDNRFSTIPIHLEYQLRGQIGGTVRSDQGMVFLCQSFPSPPPQKKGKAPETFLLDDEFNAFSSWDYTFDSNQGASFKVSNGVLSVADFGIRQGGGGEHGSWYGPIATKELSAPLDISRDDFMMKAYLSSQDNLQGALGLIWIVLLDAENTPLLGIYWSDNKHEGIGMDSYFVHDPVGNDEYGHNSWLGLYTNDGIKGVGDISGLFRTINGKVTLRKSAGQLSLYFDKDEGKPLFTSTTGKGGGVASKVKVYILKYGEHANRDMKVDYLKILKQ